MAANIQTRLDDLTQGGWYWSNLVRIGFRKSNSLIRLFLMFQLRRARVRVNILNLSKVSKKKDFIILVKKELCRRRHYSCIIYYYFSHQKNRVSHFTVKISKYFYSLATFRSIKEILYTSDGEKRELDEVNIDELLGPTLSLLALSQNFNKISPNTI